MANDYDDLITSIEGLAGALKGAEGKTFLKQQGKKLQKKTIEVAKRKINKKTGNYIKGIKNGKVYEYQGAYANRVYSAAAHAHLIEYGHKIVDKSGKSRGFVTGKYVFDTAKKEFEKEFEENTEKFIEELCKKNGF